MTKHWMTWLFLTATVGCGGSGEHHLTDGGADAPKQIDAPTEVDAKTIDAATSGAVTIAVTFEGTPAPGAIVYFQNADFSLVAELATGSDGTATQVMNGGGSVTLIEPQAPPTEDQPAVTGTPIIPNNQQVDTFADVQPGEVLHVDIDEAGEETEVTFPIIVPTDGSAANYTLMTDCEQIDLDEGDEEDVRRPGAQPAVTITLDGCGSATDMMVVTSDNNDNLLNTLYAPNVALANDTTVTLTQSYAAVGNQVVIDSSIPAQVNGFNAFHEVLSPNGLLLNSFQQFEPLTVSQGTVAVVQYAQPNAPVVSDLEQEFGNGGNLLDEQIVEDWGPPGFTTVVNATAGLLPDFTASPTYDLTDEQVQWALTGTPQTSIDGVSTLVFFTRTVGSGSGSGSAVTATWHWFVIAPGSENGAIALPTLPGDVFAFNGSAGDAIDIQGVEMAHIDGGYDSVLDNVYDWGDFDVNALSTPTGHDVMCYLNTDEVTANAKTAIRRPTKQDRTNRWRTHRALQAR